VSNAQLAPLPTFVYVFVTASQRLPAFPIVWALVEQEAPRLCEIPGRGTPLTILFLGKDVRIVEKPFDLESFFELDERDRRVGRATDMQE